MNNAVRLMIVELFILLLFNCIHESCGKPCANTCKNGVTCVENSRNSYQCNCANGWTGRTCETKITSTSTTTTPSTSANPTTSKTTTTRSTSLKPPPTTSTTTTLTTSSEKTTSTNVTEFIKNSTITVLTTDSTSNVSSHWSTIESQNGSTSAATASTNSTANITYITGAVPQSVFAPSKTHGVWIGLGCLVGVAAVVSILITSVLLIRKRRRDRSFPKAYTETAKFSPDTTTSKDYTSKDSMEDVISLDLPVPTQVSEVPVRESVYGELTISRKPRRRKPVQLLFGQETEYAIIVSA